MDYLVFTTEADALAAEQYIATAGSAPIVGTNAQTGAPVPTKQTTDRWAVPVQRLDGKWVFPRVPAELYAHMPQSVVDDFNTNHPHDVEQYDAAWFPTEEA